MLQQRRLVSDTEVVSVLRVEEALLMLAAVARHRTAKAFTGRRHERSVSEAELVHVVSVDHRQRVLGLDCMVGRMLHKCLVGRLFDVVSIVQNQVSGVLLRLAVVRAERRGNTI